MSKKRETNEVSFAQLALFFSLFCLLVSLFFVGTCKITVQKGRHHRNLAEMKRQKLSCRSTEEAKTCGSEHWSGRAVKQLQKSVSLSSWLQNNQLCR